MKIRVILLAILIAVLPAFIADGKKRTSETVKKERRDASKKVERTRGEIKSNTNQIRKELAEYESLEAEISITDSQIKALQHRTDSVTKRVNILADSVKTTETRVETLKKNYISALRGIRRQRKQASPTAYIVASKSFKEASKRVRYLRELSGRQKEKSAKLADAVKLLQAQYTTLDSVRAVLARDLAELRSKKTKLEKDRVTSKNLVSRLRKNGSRLEHVLNEQQQKVRNLDRELDRIIEEEARAAAEAERKRKAAEEAAKRKAAEEKDKSKGKASPDTAKKVTETPKPQKASARKVVNTPVASNFAQAKGKLPMPVNGPALIVGDFGRHRHKDFEKVELMNNGIDIETNTGASAVAVYPGVVSMVIVMDGYHNVVLVRHGEYLTVYAGIETLAVRKGQEVKAGDALGTIYSDPLDNGRTRLHFEVRHEKEKLNPGEWLR